MRQLGMTRNGDVGGTLACRSRAGLKTSHYREKGGQAEMAFPHYSWRGLFVAEGFDGVETGGAGGGVQAGGEADDDGEGYGAER